MKATAKAILAAFALVATTYATVIHLESREGSAAVCKGTVVVTQCTTTTSDGFLLWRNASATNNSFTFFHTASVNDSGTLGSITLILNRKESVSNAFVYTSTATNIIKEETYLTCSDGKDTERIDISANSPSSPSWALSACRFSQDSVRLSWNPPVVAPQCCDHYTLQLSTGSVNNISRTNVTVPISESITAIVHCVDHLGDSTSSQVMTIDSSTVLGVTVEVLNISCDTNTDYNISWTTNEGVCTPPITMSTITCTTSSTHQSSNNTRSMICSVPANETINATVTVTNAAGFNTSQSASVDTLAQTCQRLNRCILSSMPSRSPPPSQSPPRPSQLPPAGIAAIFMGLLLFIVAVICIVLTVYIVWKRTRPPLEEKDAVSLANLPRPKDPVTE